MKYFKNWSKEDFTWTWDKQPTTVKAGEIKPMEDYLAEHFAKHLTDRELQREKKNLIHTDREEYLSRCFADVDVKETITEKKVEKKVKKEVEVPTGEMKPFSDLKKSDASIIKKGSKE